MKTVNVTIDLYSFSELNKIAQQKAISEHESFLNSMPIKYENEEGEMISEYIEHTEAEVIESIEANQYLFFSNGELAHLRVTTQEQAKQSLFFWVNLI